jgi:hypothetical protein
MNLLKIANTIPKRYFLFTYLDPHKTSLDLPFLVVRKKYLLATFWFLSNICVKMLSSPLKQVLHTSTFKIPLKFLNYFLQVQNLKFFLLNLGLHFLHFGRGAYFL